MSSNTPIDSELKQLGSRVVGGATIIALGRPIRLLLNLGSTVVLARMIDPHDFGLLGMAIGVTRFLEVFRQAGLGAAAVQRPDLSDELSNALFWLNVGFAIFLGALTVVAAPGIAWFYSEEKLIGIVSALALGLAISGAEVQHAALLRRTLRFKALVGIEIAAATAGIVVAVALAWMKFGYWALVAKILVEQIISTIATFFASPFRPSRPRGAHGFRESVVFGLDVGAFNLINFFSRNLDDILIGRYLGPQALAFYQKAYELMMFPIRHITTPVTSVSLPALSRLIDDPDRYRDAYRRMVDLILIVSTPVAVTVGAAPEWVVGLLLGKNWVSSAPLLQALALCVLVQPLAATSGWLFTSQGRTREQLWTGVLSTALVAIGFIIGIQWGALGVAWSYSLGMGVRTPILLWMVTRTGHVNLRHMVGDSLIFFFAGAVAFACTLGFRHQFPDLHPIVGCAGAGIVAATTMLAVMAPLPAGRRALHSIFRAKELLAINMRHARAKDKPA